MAFLATVVTSGLGLGGSQDHWSLTFVGTVAILCRIVAVNFVLTTLLGRAPSAQQAPLVRHERLVGAFSQQQHIVEVGRPMHEDLFTDVRLQSVKEQVLGGLLCNLVRSEIYHSVSEICYILLHGGGLAD